MHTVEIVLLVLLLGAVTGIAARYLRAIPLPLIQIGLGALLSWPQDGLHIAFDPELFLALFIPPLLFADGWRIPKRDFFALQAPILRLALGLVLFTVLGLGTLIHWIIPGIPLGVAFALAAVVSPTDAVAVSAITRNLGMPARTMHMLQGESLLNDASGLVALKFAVAVTLTGTFSWTAAAQEFLWLALGGLGVGVLLGKGFAVARETVTRRVGDVAATQMVLLMVLLPFAAYLLSEYIGVSGILAAVAAGFTTSYADLRRSSFITERIQSEGVWTVMETAFNGAAFLLLGLQLPSILGRTLEAAGGQWWLPIGQALAISGGLLGLRWIWLSLGVRSSLWRVHERGHMPERPSPLLTLAATLAGIRGAVTLAGALSVPLLMSDGTLFPARDQLIYLATGTILCTLVIGSIGLPLALRRLPPAGEPLSAREDREARLAACRAVIEFLARPPPDAPAGDPAWRVQHQEAAGLLTQDYRKRIDMLDAPKVAQTPEAQAESAAVAYQRRQRYLLEMELRLDSLRIERETLYAERQAHRINDDTLRALVAELDLSEVSLRKRLVVARRALGLPVDEPGH
ncbi:sodium:proton antiporter [Steroidobacter denitrificans]|uniref:Sodium:proton antiporter n=1 Tax=Steroidobacter denitrificans TaxID=465721 RepID=A0A127FB68_STEDE|nr:Na+/H+ antiporter [Steroidobacter denitrificans]AMN46799.1 sodium:proton antiporter [Steroidobacter denitrificans]